MIAKARLRHCDDERNDRRRKPRMHGCRFSSKVVEHVLVILAETVPGIQCLTVIRESHPIRAVHNVEILRTNSADYTSWADLDTIRLRWQQSARVDRRHNLDTTKHRRKAITNRSIAMGTDLLSIKFR
jgi:hypothetical protein